MAAANLVELWGAGTLRNVATHSEAVRGKVYGPVIDDAKLHIVGMKYKRVPHSAEI